MPPDFILVLAAWSPLHFAVFLPFFVLFVGSLIYSLLAFVALQRFRRYRTLPSPAMPFVSVVVRVRGAVGDLRENLRSFFEQDYPEFEVVMSVETFSDPGARVVREVAGEYPQTNSSLIAGFDAALDHARYDVLLLTEGSVHAAPDLLRVVSAELDQPGVALVTSPHRVAVGTSFWPVMHAIGSNTTALADALAERMVTGFVSPTGPAVGIRREVLQEIGGWRAMEGFFSQARARGAMRLSPYVIEQRVGSPEKSPRRIFASPLPWALFTVACAPRWWPALVLAIAARYAVAMLNAGALNDPLTRDYWYLVPLEDLVAFAEWIAGWFSRSKTREKPLKSAPADYEAAAPLPKQRSGPDRD